MNQQLLKTVRGYELRERIGAGGFGAVYRAYQPVVDREVAIKVILPQYTNNPDFVRNFEVEAKMIAHLEHPFIVPLFDYWREPDGAFLVMRFYQAGSLRQLLERQGALPVERVTEILTQVGGALETAHRHHVIHRDVKPENILLDEEGNAYVADFGIAKKSDPEKSDKDEKEPFSGTLAYAAPELLERGSATPQSDIYGLGYVVYELLTGKHAFADQSPLLLLMSHAERELPTVDRLPAPAMATLLRATAKNPDDRYVSARAFALEFQQGLRESNQELVIIPIAPDEIVNPYKGLRPFDEADAADFFGREALVQQLLAQLGSDGRWHNFLAVIGPSGSGKSSAVHAGLVPALRSGKLPHSEGWYILTMTPGARPLQQLRTLLLSIAVDPLDTLSGKLRDNSQGLVEALQDVLQIDHDLCLVVDQFEEVFTLVEDEQERRQFLTLLYSAANTPNSRLHVIVTLRADFYDKPLLYEDFGSLVQARTQVVLPLSTQELEQATSGPARKVGLTIDPDLVAAVVADVRQEPGALPLLQYALTEVFEQREGNRLTLAGYEKSGKILGALARRAEDVYASLNPDQQSVAQQLFLRLVAPGEGTEDTRRRARFSELTALNISRSTLQVVLDAFGKYRLLTFDRDDQTREPTIEIAHEALIRGWKRLRGWLDESRTDIRLQRQLASSAADWRKGNSDASYLLSGARLAQFEEWAKAAKLALSQEERTFLDASIAESERLKTIERERQAHDLEVERHRLKLERRNRQRLQIFAVFLAVGLIAVIGLAAFAFQQSTAAQLARDVAQRQRDVANSDNLSTKAQQLVSQGDTVTALSKSLEAAAIADPPTEVMDTLIDVAYGPGLRRVVPPANNNGHAITALAISADGRYLLSGSGQASGEVRRGPPPDSSGQSGAATLPPTGAPPPPGAPPLPNNDSLILWDLATGQPIRTLQSDSTPIQDMTFLPTTDNSVQAVVATTDGTIRVWDVANSKVTDSFSVPPTGNLSLSASQDGQSLLIVGGVDPNAKNQNPPNAQTFQLVRDVKNKQMVQQVDPAEQGLWTGALSPDGKTAVLAYLDGTQATWDVQSGQTLNTYKNLLSGAILKVPFYHVAIGPDNTTVVLNSGEPQVILWDIKTGQALKQFNAPSVNPLNAELHQVSQNSGQLLITTGDGRLALWDIQKGTLLRSLTFLRASFTSAAFSFDGLYAVTGASDGSLYFWDLLGTPIRELGRFGQGEIKQAAYLPGGNQVLSFGDNGDPKNPASQLIVWDINTGKPLRTFGQGHVYMPMAMAVSPDGKYAITGTVADVPGVPRRPDVNDAVIVWDVQNGTQVRRFETTDNVFSLAFDPQSGTGGHAYQAAMPQGNNVALVNVETGSAVRTFSGHSGAIRGIAFSPDGTELAANGMDNQLLIWNIASGELVKKLSMGGAPSITFSPDGKLIATAGNQNTIALWNIATGQIVQTLTGHQGGINSFAFSADGKLGLSGSQDDTLILWDVTTGKQIHQYTEPSTSVWDVAFSPDQKSFLSAANGIILWRATPITLDEIKSWVSANRYLPPTNSAPTTPNAQPGG